MWPERWAFLEFSRMNTDDRLSPYALGPVESVNGIVESGHLADVCPQPTIPETLN